MSRAMSTAWSALSITSVYPGMVLTFASCASFFDAILSPIASIERGFGPMKTMPVLLEQVAERRVLGQEAVAGMHGLGAGVLARLEDAVHHEITLGRRRRPDQHRLVREEHVLRVPVGLRVNRDGRDAHAFCGANDAAGDLAAVGNQDLLEHGFFREWGMVIGDTFEPRALAAPAEVTTAALQRRTLAPAPFPLVTAECSRVCATGSRASCCAASRAIGRCACASRSA